MKFLTASILALSLALGACAHKDTSASMSTQSSSTTTGYSK